MRGEGGFGVIDVYSSEILEADDLIERIHGDFERGRSAEIVPTGKGVAGI